MDQINTSWISINFSESSSFGNQTTKILPSWSFNSLFFLAVCVLGLICNGTTLLVFIHDAHLRSTPFNIYLMNLFTANTASLLIQYPMAVAVNRYQSGWHLGNPACTMYLYCQTILGAGVLTLHALIAANRTWAILHPLSYRAVHSTRFASTLCGFMWLYVHLTMGPYMYVDTFYYRLDVEQTGCDLNHSDIALALWSVTLTIVVYILPVCVVLSSFPVVVACKALRSERKRRRSSRLGSDDLYVHKSVSHLLGQPMDRRITAPSLIVGYNKQVRERQSDVSRKQSKDPVIASSRAVCGCWSSKYIILALLTISVAICSAPDMLYFLLVGIIPGFWNQTYLQLATLLFSCQTVLDPILFVLALERLRKSLLRMINCTSQSGPLHVNV
ncbi:hypothetical protein BV898_15649 [Hypsibius exemplaris]|uniref:G-protein coupled receptors family 1 profile domain-containing protein n=1 Tax=Hypsibius exemplaris TaxID=2072580 RepID=A0A9X6RKN4_HYPEX|nr:hypothetical protein BV898_15649 [Hypsibius exemplaris]